MVAIGSNGTGACSSPSGGSRHTGIGSRASRLFGHTVDLFEAGLTGSLVLGVLYISMFKTS